MSLEGQEVRDRVCSREERKPVPTLCSHVNVIKEMKMERVK